MISVSDLIRPSGVHSSLYTDPTIFAEEMAQIFGQNWVYVGHESEVPERGDYLRRNIGTEPIILVRGAKGVSVLANRCTHRGNLLCQAERGKTRNFACQYHGWVFNPEGELVDTPFPAGQTAPRETLGLRRATVESYRGFVFATFAEHPRPLAEHLGNARQVLDRTSDQSPLGEVQIGKTWIKHMFHANWKMLSENEADGYHVTFVHDSFAKAIRRQAKYGNVLQGEEKRVTAVARSLGNGHAELDYGPTYGHPMHWLGVPEDRFPAHIEAMHQAYGVERANHIMQFGPPHAFIFPNLFLAETCIVMIQPVDVGHTLNCHAPLLLKGAPDEVNMRILRQGEVAMGPSSFLTSDDSIIAERQWRALRGVPGWLDLTRGLNREHRREDGVVEGHYTDEAPNRGFWQHYASLMRSESLSHAA